MEMALIPKTRLKLRSMYQALGLVEAVGLSMTRILPILLGLDWMAGAGDEDRGKLGVKKCYRSSTILSS